MSTSLNSLVIAAIDDLNWILSLQKLLEIGLEQFDQPPEKTQERIDLLLRCYFSQVKPHFEDLKRQLEIIRQEAATLVTEPP